MLWGSTVRCARTRLQQLSGDGHEPRVNVMANQGAADQAFLSERAARFKKERYSKPPSTPKPGPEGEEDAESRHRHIVFSKDPDAQTHSFVRSVCSSVIIRPRPERTGGSDSFDSK